jgi:hypothetical protein
MATSSGSLQFFELRRGVDLIPFHRLPFRQLQQETAFECGFRISHLNEYLDVLHTGEEQLT